MTEFQEVPPRPNGISVVTIVLRCRMAECAWCGIAFVVSGRRRFHTDACRQAAYRARHQAEPIDPIDRRIPKVAGPDTTVYECPSCSARYLGARRCGDCNLFCRRIGPGGLCPNCEEPVAHKDLSG